MMYALIAQIVLLLTRLLGPMAQELPGFTRFIPPGLVG